MGVKKVLSIFSGGMVLILIAYFFAWLTTDFFFGIEYLDLFRKRINQPKVFAANFYRFLSAFSWFFLVNITIFLKTFDRFLGEKDGQTEEEKQDHRLLKKVLVFSQVVSLALMHLFRQDTAFYN